ncbi:MAG: efflux RND transporter periplasmic adaptor subunit [Myxococcales bacterium]|nr:efflux RND transporter periplasmic adaptor subunit [Myxococcales bacterium]
MKEKLLQRLSSGAGRGLLLLAVALGAFVVGRSAGDGGGERGAAPPATEDKAETIWTCSMHPQIRMPEPGQCPICGMDLIPLEHGGESGKASDHELTLSPQARALARVRTMKVTRTDSRVEVRLPGHIDYDETRMRTITAWTGGRIDRLRVKVTGSEVKRGQVVAMLYSPDVYAAFGDLVAATRQAEQLAGSLHGSGALAERALSAARERLRLLGVPARTIEQVEASSEAPRQVEVHSPYAGTVLERLVDEGQYVKEGAPLLHVADLSRVWVQIDAYESDLPHLRVDQEVVVEVRSLPGEAFVGRVAFVDPVVDAMRRTARVRVEVDNSEGQLRPGMFVEGVISTRGSARLAQLVIADTAPLFTGRRSVVYVARPGQEDSYELRVVRLGPKSGPYYPVLSGLSEGEEVVVHGAFVIDADLQLRGGRSMMMQDDDSSAPPPLVVPDAMRVALAAVVEPYLRAQAALATDDFEAAKRAFEELLQQASGLEAKGPRATRDVWQEAASVLTSHGKHAASAADLASQRSGFEHLSGAMIALLQRLGNPLDEPLREAYCPMAMDSKGAGWLQRDGDLINPYYGAAMLRCGEFKSALLPGEYAVAGAEAKPASEPAPAKAPRKKASSGKGKTRATPPAKPKPKAPAAPPAKAPAASGHENHQGHSHHGGH